MTPLFEHGELPYGIFSVPGGEPRVGVAVGDRILDLASLFGDTVFFEPSLNGFMAQGREAWTAARAEIRHALRSGADSHLVPAASAMSHLPFEVADFVDFNSSLRHATNVGRILRPGSEPVRPNWYRMPVGYHGRSGTVVVSETPIVRPRGQYAAADDVIVAPTAKLDVEAEVGFVVGTPSVLSERVSTSDFSDHVFGVVLVLDWSARDIQSYEYVPLGPFLGKSFATSMSAWVLPLEALNGARARAPVQEPAPADYLRVDDPSAFDLRLELSLNGTAVSAPRFDDMYWTPPQQLAHLTVNGARVRTGDLFASGTVSSGDQCGSFLELTSDGERPLRLADGSTRGYLADGDRVLLRATAYCADGARLSLGPVGGTVSPARPGVGVPH